MDLLKPVKSLVKGAKRKMKEYGDEQDMIKEAQKLKDEFNLAKMEKVPWDTKFDREEQIYMGDREFGNIYSTSSRDDARTIVRMSQTVIESQIDLSIPDVVLKPVSKDDEQAVKKLQSEIDYSIRKGDMNEVNSLAEREVKKYGIVVYKVLSPGKNDFKVICVHPKNILWASGTTDKNKCRCWYHVENETLQECEKRYGKAAKNLPRLGERADLKYDEIGTKYESGVNKTDDVTNSPDVYSRPNEDPLAKYLIVEKWYLDDDDECCLLTFSGDCILLKKPKFYHARKINAETEEYEYGENGDELLEDEDAFIVDYVEKTDNGENEAKIEAGENVPRFFPKGPESIPIVIQNNIPRSKAIPGISDIERTYDYEQSMKKMINKHEERILKGTTKILYNKNAEEEAAPLLDNDELNVIPVNDVANFLPVEFKDKGKEAVEFYDFLKQDLQYQLGITQAWQGDTKGEAKSGKAIQALVNQTAEKISIKVNEKNIAYKRIYRLLCYFILCFSNGELSYRLDNTLEPEYGTFNKYEMLRKDDSGHWIWVDYDIEISAEAGFPKTKTAMADMIIQLGSGGYLDASPRNLLVWQLLNKLGFPQSESILQAMQQEIQKQEQLQAQQQQMQNAQAQDEMALKQQAQTQKTQQQGQKEQQQNDKKVLAETIKYLPEDIRKLFKQLPEAQQMALIGGQNAG